MKNLYSLLVPVILLLLVLPKQILGQSKQIDRQIFYGLRYAPSFNIGNNWRIKGEVEFRRFASPDRQHQLFLPRITIRKRLPNGWHVGAGMLYLRQSLPQNPDANIGLVRPELRPHQELTMKNTWGDIGVSHRYRLEERFKRKINNNKLASGYYFNFRFRYRLQFSFPLNSKKGAGRLLLKLYNEIMVNFGEQIVRNTFDQNRIYLGLASRLSDRTGLEAGLMNLFQQRSSGDDYRNRYILRITFFQLF